MLHRFSHPICIVILCFLFAFPSFVSAEEDEEYNNSTTFSSLLFLEKGSNDNLITLLKNLISQDAQDAPQWGANSDKVIAECGKHETRAEEYAKWYTDADTALAFTSQSDPDAKPSFYYHNTKDLKWGRLRREHKAGPLIFKPRIISLFFATPNAVDLKAEADKTEEEKKLTSLLDQLSKLGTYVNMAFPKKDKQACEAALLAPGSWLDKNLQQPSVPRLLEQGALKQQFAEGDYVFEVKYFDNLEAPKTTVQSGAASRPRSASDPAVLQPSQDDKWGFKTAHVSRGRVKLPQQGGDTAEVVLDEIKSVYTDIVTELKDQKQTQAEKLEKIKALAANFGVK